MFFIFRKFLKQDENLEILNISLICFFLIHFTKIKKRANWQKN